MTRYIAPQDTNSAYELVAHTRPRVRRDTLFTRTPEGVLFHNAHGGFRVDAKGAYRFFAAGAAPERHEPGGGHLPDAEPVAARDGRQDGQGAL